MRDFPLVHAQWRKVLEEHPIFHGLSGEEYPDFYRQDPLKRKKASVEAGDSSNLVN